MSTRPTVGGSLTVVFAGGGTGGHIYPGLAIAEEVGERRADARFVHLCSQKPIDAEILRAEGRPFVALGARPFGVRPRALVTFLGAWGGSVRSARETLREAKRAGPVRVVALGGYVAPPVVQAARVERCRVLMVNLDAVPGKANRWIARRATRTLSAAAGGPASWERIGPVVRRAARAHARPGECRARFGLHPDRPTLLVTGGSLGAGSLNALLLHLVRGGARDFGEWQVIHQCGRDRAAGQSAEAIQAAYNEAGIAATVTPLIEAMGEAWGAASLALCRAGAGTVAEAWANRVPCVFLPYPYHRDQHQRANAEPLVAVGAAEVVRDLIEPGANAGTVGARLVALMKGPQHVERMRAAARSLPAADGAARVATAILAE